jgi:hypothetical protein
MSNAIHQKQNNRRLNSEFTDTRPDISQRGALRGMVNHSLGVRPLKALPEMAKNSPRSMQLKAIQKTANNSDQVKGVAQFQVMANNYMDQQYFPVQKKTNNTGLPDNLKTGVENLSGLSMDDVKVHYNSSRPLQVNAHAYAQGRKIHLGPGQEKHLPHEAWHVVQQKQGRVQARRQMKAGRGVNEDVSLEKEADLMGVKAVK